MKNKNMMMIGAAILGAALLIAVTVVAVGGGGKAGPSVADAQPAPMVMGCPKVECPACATCEACPPSLGYDAVGSISYWILDNNRRNGKGVYVTATFHHTGGRWVPDLINSTGGVKPESGMRELVDPEIALNKCLKVARENQGAGTVYIENIPFDYGKRSATFNVWAPSDDGYKTVYAASVLLIP